MNHEQKKKQQITLRSFIFSVITIGAVFILSIVDAMRPTPTFITTTTMMNGSPTAVPYPLPHWCRNSFTNPPKHGRFQLAHVPTPLYRVFVPLATTTTNDNTTSVGSILQNCQSTLFIKRDDCTHGIEMGGNKIRKLEFLLADAVALQHDAIVTIGGVQSNHCRATAGAARMLGLRPHLILRRPSTSSSSSSPNTNENDIGLVGNLLYDRMVGSRIYTCTAGEYGRIGSTELLQRVARYIQTQEDQSPYIIPVGGSNGVGTWGYINAVDELLTQWNSLLESNGSTTDDNELHHIVVACGSGGTAAGIALGIALAYHYYHDEEHNDHDKLWIRRASKPPIVHAIGVCDDADYFYQHIAKIAYEMGFIVPDRHTDDDNSSPTRTIEQYIRRHLMIHQGKGRGYGQSTKEELDFIIKFAQDTGVVLDPVYTGKALYNFFLCMQQQSNDITMQNTNEINHQNILFWHTGGGLGLFDKSNDMLDRLTQHSPCQKLDLYGNGNGVDISR